MQRQKIQPLPARPDHLRPRRPSFVVSHDVGIDEAPEAYRKFDQRVEGYTKVLLHPNGAVE